MRHLLPVLLALLPLGLAAADGEFRGRKVLYVNAYHEGYAWSDGIEQTVKAKLAPSGAELQVFRMDTKNNPAKDFAVRKGEEVKALIATWKPDVVLLSDDNPVRCILQPHFKDAALPFVFCAVNYNGSAYGLPYVNTCGMYEVNLIASCVDNLAKSAKGKRVTWLAADVESSRTDGRYIGEALQAKGYTLSESFVKDWAGWQAAYKQAQTTGDMLIMLNAGIKDWPVDGSAEAFHEAEAKVPSGCMQAENAPFCLMGFCKLPEEQGEFLVDAALKILGGKKPGEVGETVNKKAKIIINLKLARKLGITPDAALLRQAELIK